MPDTWQRRIDRAAELADRDAAAASLLTQYAAVLKTQRTCYDALLAHGEQLTGSLERDLAHVRPGAAAALTAVVVSAPPQAVSDAPHDAAAIDALLLQGWRRSSIPFLPRVVLQAYAELLARVNRRPHDRDLQAAGREASCPFCGGPPQLSILQAASNAESGERALLCATCSTAWPSRRVLCPYCGEEDERRLGYFHAAGPPFDHLRVDVCDTCGRYLKAVDLTRFGKAVPAVDEVAGATLDLWAVDRGYRKIEVNMIGL